MSSICGDSDNEVWVRSLFDPPPTSCGLEPTFSVPGSDLRTLEARAKRTRSKNWSPEEKLAYLEAKVETLQVVKGQGWDFISKRLRESHGYERSSKCCEDFWYTILKAYRAIRRHEASKNGPRTNEWVSYWGMDDDEKRMKKLPAVFEFHWYEMIEEILTLQQKRSPRTDPPGPSNAKNSCRKGSGVIIEEEPGQLLIEALPPFLKQQIGDEVNSALASLPCRKARGATTEQDELLTSIAPFVKQQVEAAVLIEVKILALSGVIIDADDSITRLAPFVREYIKDALSSALQRVSSTLQALAQKEQEYQKQLEDIEERRRALDLEEMEIERQRVGRHQRRQRTRYTKQGTGGKNFSAGVIPALKGMSIARDEDQVVLPKDA